ncbi:uncharacterized protein [Prorops nasuta]|uniref:uncharacterized protein isoform X2 n=1 Tax=Prorops nasuta TaxID=863751 RepID=UPI0034CD4566
MKTQPFHLEILAVLFLSVIPWPGPSVFKISCPRERASVVRRIVQKRWIPILKKYHVELPLECPFHESRDIFRPQQKAKQQHRPSQWTCGLCGKSFYAEKHLEAHFDNRHKNNVNTVEMFYPAKRSRAACAAEDAVCLADYCDVMRCDVLGNRDFGSSSDDDAEHLNTDIQVWKESTERRMPQSTPCEARDMARSRAYREKSCAIGDGSAISNLHQYCREDTNRGIHEDHRGLPETLYNREVVGPDNKSNPCEDEDEEEEEEEEEDEEEETEADEEEIEADEEEENERGETRGNNSRKQHQKQSKKHETLEDEDEKEENLVEAALPAVDKKQRRKRMHLRKLKSNCKPEELQKLKVQCEVLVRDCIAGLLTNLSLRDFQEIEGELNRAICWYLSCDRYWEDTKRQQRHASWYLLTIFLIILFTSVYACYYVIWVLFNSPDEDRYDGSTRSGKLDRTGRDVGASSPLHDSGAMRAEGRLDERRKGEYGEELANTSGEDMPDHYIYVAYPPDLKRRLLESCYNRTTRL